MDKYDRVLELQRRYWHNRYERLKAAGLCTTCGTRPATPGRTICQACRERSAKNQNALYHRRREQGLCVICGKPAYNGQSMCLDHLLDNCKRSKKSQAKMDRREYLARLRAEGICTTCCSRPAVEGMAKCEICRERGRMYSRKAYRKSKALGLCVVCGRPAYKGMTRCLEHAVKCSENTLNSRRRKKENDDGGSAEIRGGAE